MINNEALDDPVAPDETPNFAGGLASYPPRTQLQPGQFYRGINTMITQLGVVQTRRGFSYLGTAQPAGAKSCFALGYLETSTTRKLLGFFTDGAVTVKQYDGTSWSNAAGWTPTNGYEICAVQGLDKLYLSNGIDNVRSWDGAAFVDLGAGATDAPKAKYLVWGTNRLIAGGIPSAPDTVAFSDILDPSSTHWSAANRIRVGAGDGLPITGMAMWTKTLLAVFKKNRIYLVNIDPAISVSQFTIDEVPGTVGCVEHRTIVPVGRDLFFLAPDGLRSMSRVLQGEDTQVNLPLSLPIHDQMRFLQPVSGSYDEVYARAAFFAGRLFLNHYSAAVTHLDGTYADGPNLSVFNVNLGVWEGRWTVSAVQMVVTNFGNKPRLVVAQTYDVLYWRHEDGNTEVADDFEDDNYAGASQAIHTVIATRGHTLGTTSNDKQGLACEIEFAAGNTADSARVRAIADDGTPAVLEAALAVSGRRPLTLLHQPPFRQLALDLYSTGKKLAVRSVKVSGFINTMPVGT